MPELQLNHTKANSNITAPRLKTPLPFAWTINKHLLKIYLKSWRVKHE